MEALLSALDQLAMQCVLLWPNIDAGADHISKAIRAFRLQSAPKWLRTITNLAPDDYLRVLANTSCAAGNSSSFVRDAGYFGTPVVLVGNRQDGRETSWNVAQARPVADEIATAIRRQLLHGRYAASTLYGDGWTSERIAEALCVLRPYAQKKLDYVNDAVAVVTAGD
jgi:UDP-N-acetylglucosamine 2-epimerase